MVSRESLENLGGASPALLIGVIGSGLSVMAALVASCWVF